MIEVLEKPAAGPVIRLHEADNVVIARSNVEIGTKLGDGLTCRSQVPSGHKIATRAIKQGEPILKYNVTIGFAAADIAPGPFLHSHHLEFPEFVRHSPYATEYPPVPPPPETCHPRASRTTPYCGKAVVSLSEAPADVQQKMLNPLKASKTASKK